LANTFGKTIKKAEQEITCPAFYVLAIDAAGGLQIEAD